MNSIYARACLRVSLVSLLVLSSHSGLAAQETMQSADDEALEGGYVKLGLGYRASTPNRARDHQGSGASAFINARYQLANGLFAELTNYRMLNDGTRVGYNFYNPDGWNFDVITLKAHQSLDFPGWQNNKLTVHYRKSTQMLGVRATGSFNKTTVQFSWAPYSFNREYDDGMFASLWVDQSFQYKNWQMYANTGLVYRSEEIINYYFGVPEEIASYMFPAYSTSSGTEVSAEVGALYPISQHWMFETYFKYSHMPRSINNSPWVAMFNKAENRDGHVSELGILVSFVF
ncbi:MipA/OmpV family protein [Pseudoalteromonas rubra]|uniref:MipA/OmpV family protein n=1 Tax=Pseudoalteromonas rubra TaxID=43658 RepID=UPI000F7A4548|nr:MipA/OmpV family protein [Pseudoalteromonas rubra]